MPTAPIILNGIMNLDDSNNVITSGFHKNARNIRWYGMPGNMRAEHIKGTRPITNSLPAGINYCMGALYDGLKQRVLYFNQNSNGRDGIYQYNTKTGIITPLLVCFTHSATNILNFNKDYPIVSVDILYTTEADGDILHWTDRLNRPQKLNITDAATLRFGSAWLAEYLTVDKPSPALAPTCIFADNAAVPINNLRKKLYQFTYRFIYKDFTTSIWSPYSKLFSPANPDDLSTEVNQLKNNLINVTVQTGTADALKIEIAARHQIETTFSDPFSVIILDKALLTIDNNVSYVYPFYNDGSYDTVNISEIINYLNYVPRKANTQCLLNGNVLCYGGITEGYTFSETLNVSATISLVDNGTNVNPLTITTQNNQTFTTVWSGKFYIYMTGIPQPGDTVQLTIVAQNSGGSQGVVFNYTVLAGNTIAEVSNYFRDAVNGSVLSTTYNLIAGNQPLNEGINIQSTNGTSHVLLVQPVVTLLNPPAAATTDVNIAAYKHFSLYRFGIVYFDDYGQTNGVVTNTNFIVRTTEIDTTGSTQFKIPAIQFSVTHQPPIWAKYFSWVRTPNTTVANFLTTVSAATFKNTESAWLNITNQNTNTSNFPSYDFAEGDRVRIIGKSGAAITTVYDTAIIKVETNPVGPGTGTWVKVAYAAALSNFGTAGFEKYYVELYSPAKNNDDYQRFYYEFGETYKVGNPGLSTRYHIGQQQSQVVGSGAQPAIYNFTRGDVYIRQRLLALNADGTGPQNIWLLDQSVSDKYPSRVSSNGRAFSLDKYAKETYYPTLRRYSLAYQQGTNINQTNKFYHTNFDELDRQKGDIQRFEILANRLITIQSRACGQSGIYEEMTYNADGSSNLILTNTILNKNHYYQGDFGCGDQYCGVTRSSGALYFTDPVNGYQCRLAGDGITPISKIYKAQFYIPTIVNLYLKTGYVTASGAKPKILGVYDFFNEEFITVFQSGNIPAPANTLTFSPIVLGDAYYVYFVGTPIAGYTISIAVAASTSETATYTYTIQTGDTTSTISTALVNSVNAGGVFEGLGASSGGNLGLRIRKGGANTTGTATFTYSVALDTIAGDTLAFSEIRNGYSSFYDYQPECVICAENNILSFKNGVLYIHDSTTYNTFYGVAYSGSVTVVFNTNPTAKKEFLTVGFASDVPWGSPNIITATGQPSNLVVSDYTDQREGRWEQAFGRDTNSIGGWADGGYLVGTWVQIIFTNSSTSHQFLHAPIINYMMFK